MASHCIGVSMLYKLIAKWNLCLVTKRTFQKHKLVKLSNGPGESPARNEPKGKWWTYSDTWKYIWGLRCSSEFSMLNSVIYFHSTAVSNKFKFKFWKIKHAKESHTGNIYSIIHFDAKLKANPSMFFSIILHPDFPLSVCCKISYWQHRPALQELSGQSWRFWQVEQGYLRLLASRKGWNVAWLFGTYELAEAFGTEKSLYHLLPSLWAVTEGTWNLWAWRRNHGSRPNNSKQKATALVELTPAVISASNSS